MSATRTASTPLLSPSALSDLAACLLSQRTPAGAWDYQPAAPGSAEPTAWAILALQATSDAPVPLGSRPDLSSAAFAAADWLVSCQAADGGVPIARGMRGPHWPTPLAVLAWDAVARRLAATGASAHRFEAAVGAAIAWLEGHRGRPTARQAGVHDHDTTLRGWSWVDGTQSWVEPTSYALLALCAAGRSSEPAAREAAELLLNRALAGGGWNYGNRRVLDHDLRPFPAATGVALAALAGEAGSPPIQASIRWLLEELPNQNTPLSVAWSVIGLRRWHALPGDLGAAALARAVDRLHRGGAQPLHTAMLLLAGAAQDLLPELAAGSRAGWHS